ncbi:glucokinase [Govanella unica]|uniref:Glucokinase n=1 Tax=Govanella unica TaxID=2975056 RepID=A0A9X3Z7M3_9PROT|nr:glucokinase [Govania unica]MDA5194208.1 glucokinase [Govania unica]
MDVVAVDLGGTNARFAIARIAEGRVIEVGDMTTLATAHYATFQSAWEDFAARHGGHLPSAAAIAVACPVKGREIKLTNCPWVLSVDALRRDLDRLTLVNDFGAVGHAVRHLDTGHLQHVMGPDRPLPEQGLISIIGPGTGLGVAHLLRRNGHAYVIETEGGHSDFAPLDAIEDHMLGRLRERYLRVSVERLVSGPGLLGIYETLAEIDGAPRLFQDDKSLWAAALDGSDRLAVAALDRFCLIFGSVAGDIALTQGASAVVIAGGVGLRLADRLAHSGFARRFSAKGRFEAMMMELPVKLITHPHVGLIGAAAAFAEEHGL